MDCLKVCDRLELDDERLFDKEINTMFADRLSAVENRHGFLPFERKAEMS